MEKEFVPYELALRMKQLGFNEPCLGYYTHNEKLCSYGSNEINIECLFCTHKDIYKTYSLAPTFSQVFRWFREKHGLYGIPEERALLNNFSYQVKSNKEGAITFIVYGGYPLNFKSYDEAETACLEKLIGIVEQTNAEMTEHEVYK
jgi:hypothetical protein